MRAPSRRTAAATSWSGGGHDRAGAPLAGHCVLCRILERGRVAGMTHAIASPEPCLRQIKLVRGGAWAGHRPQGIDQKTLREWLNYDPVTGVFTWIRTGRGIVIDRPAGRIRKSSTGQTCYLMIGLLRGEYFAHRLAWLYMTGGWPTEFIDHRDMNGLNNAWGNLRPAGKAQNAQNSRRGPRNTTGYKGVSRSRARFRATIRIAGKSRHLGCFNTAEEAHEAYIEAAQQHFGRFARAR